MCVKYARSRTFFQTLHLDPRYSFVHVRAGFVMGQESKRTEATGIFRLQLLDFLFHARSYVLGCVPRVSGSRRVVPTCAPAPLAMRLLHCFESTAPLASRILRPCERSRVLQSLASLYHVLRPTTRPRNDVCLSKCSLEARSTRTKN